MCKNPIDLNTESVFIDLFSKKEYLESLYKAMHPEASGTAGSDDHAGGDADEGDTVDPVSDNTKPVPITDIRFTAGGMDSCYDLITFNRGGRIVIVAEMKSVWTPSILLDLLAEAVNIIYEKLQEHKDENGIEKPDLPGIEFNIIYAKGRRSGSRVIKLSDEFFGGKKSDFDVKARVFYNGKDNDILAQYAYFCRICEANVRDFGCTGEAKEKTISACLAKGALMEYLMDEDCADRAFKMVANSVASENRVLYVNEEKDEQDHTDLLLMEALGTMYDFGVSREDAVQYAVNRFDSINADYADEKAGVFWGEVDGQNDFE